MNMIHTFFLVITLFIMFSIGFNIGMHGLIDVHGADGSVDIRDMVMNELTLVEHKVEEFVHNAKMADDEIEKSESRTNTESDRKGTIFREGIYESKINDFDHLKEAKKEQNKREGDLLEEVSKPPLDERKEMKQKEQFDEAYEAETRLHAARELKRKADADAHAKTAANAQTHVDNHPDMKKTDAARTGSSPPKQSAYTRLAVDAAGKNSNELYKRRIIDVSKMPHIPDRDDISEYVAKGGKIPIILLTCNRAKLLQQTLGSLFAVRGVSKDQVLVVQDGIDKAVEQVVRQAGLTLLQNTENSRLRWSDGAARIATHYRFTLTQAFSTGPNAPFSGEKWPSPPPCAIVIEDDLLFSPDFLEYFEAVGPLLDTDSTAFVISSWSDNGYKGKVDDPYAIQRTEYFPGLGWLLPRRLWELEFKDTWPSAHWDHWLRSAQVNKGREIIFPQVPRTFHNGIKGTFMDLETHNRLFKNVDYNTDRAVGWKGAEPHSMSLSDNSASKIGLAPMTDPLYAQGVLSVYEARVTTMIKKCTHVQSTAQLVQEVGGNSAGMHFPTKIDVSLMEATNARADPDILCLWIDVVPDPPIYPPPFQSIANFFGLWHEHRRGAHKGLHEFYWDPRGKVKGLSGLGKDDAAPRGGGAGKYVMLLNIHTRDDNGPRNEHDYNYHSYSWLRPKGVQTIPPYDFDQALMDRVVMRA